MERILPSSVAGIQRSYTPFILRISIDIPHQRGLICMKVILQNTVNILRRPVDATIDSQDRITPASSILAMVRLGRIPNKVMRMIGCITNLQY